MDASKCFYFLKLDSELTSRCVACGSTCMVVLFTASVAAFLVLCVFLRLDGLHLFVLLLLLCAQG